MEDIIKQVYKQAKLIGACSLFKGTERTTKDMVRLFLTPLGIEFCIKNHFPNMATFRAFAGQQLDKYGIYIDAGDITLKNPTRAILIGRTCATIYCDQTEQHNIILLHEAKAIVSASRWAVVRVQAEQGCHVIKTTSGHAVIL